jgi:AcrR family transcriptional regulator
MSAPAPARKLEALTSDARILETAAAHLRRFGPARTTIVAVAEEAGMSHANVYRYFPSKVALIDEVTAAWLRPIEAEARMIADGPDPAPDKLERVLFALHRSYRDKLERDPVLFELLCEGARADKGVARQHRSRVQNIVQRILDEGIAQAAFSGGDLRKAQELVFDLSHRFVQPVAIAMDAGANRAAVDARAARVTRLTLRALASGAY